MPESDETLRANHTSPVLAAFVRAWIDGLPGDEQQQLNRSMRGVESLVAAEIPRLVGTAGSAELEQRRAWMATDWLVRTHAPTWLRLAGVTDHADLLAGLPEITAHTVESAQGQLEPAREAAAPWTLPQAAVAGTPAATAWNSVKTAGWAVAARPTRTLGWAVAVGTAAGYAAAENKALKPMTTSALYLLGRMINAEDDTHAAEVQVASLPEGMTADRLREIAGWLDTYDTIVERVIFTLNGDDVLTGDQLNTVRGKDVQDDLRRWADAIETGDLEPEVSGG